MKVRRKVSRPDTSAWPEFDPGALTPAQRTTFSARRRAVEMFVADTSLAEIEAQTGVNPREVYRALERASALHVHGSPYGLLQDRRNDFQRAGAARVMLPGQVSQSRRPQTGESLRKISTRRFCKRLLSLSLPATGSREPRPTTVMRSRATPRTLR